MYLLIFSSSESLSSNDSLSATSPVQGPVVAASAPQARAAKQQNGASSTDNGENEPIKQDDVKDKDRLANQEEEHAKEDGEGKREELAKEQGEDKDLQAKEQGEDKDLQAKEEKEEHAKEEEEEHSKEDGDLFKSPSIIYASPPTTASNIHRSNSFINAFPSSHSPERTESIVSAPGNLQEDVIKESKEMMTTLTNGAPNADTSDGCVDIPPPPPMRAPGLTKTGWHEHTVNTETLDFADMEQEVRVCSWSLTLSPGGSCISTGRP